MGIAGSKRVPSKLVSTKLLGNPKKSKFVDFPITGRLCVAAIKVSSDPVCEKQLDLLKCFISKPSKVPIHASRSHRIVESEVCHQLKNLSKKAATKLSPDGKAFLAKTLKDTKSELGFFDRQPLLRRRILPQLQKLLVQDSRNNPKVTLASLLRLWHSNELHAKDMRKYPRTLTPDPELDRAHKLSLFLAVKLWQCVFGHNYISQKDRINLKKSLCHNANLIYTCKFTNRVMHVRYDNEIASALTASSKATKLSSGAVLRVIDILATIKTVQNSDSRKTKKYWEKTEKILKSLI
jgi:hypothetical protein